MSIDKIVNSIDWTKPNLCRLHEIESKSLIGLCWLCIKTIFKILFLLPLDFPLTSPKIILVSFFREDLLDDFNQISLYLSDEFMRIDIKRFRKF